MLTSRTVVSTQHPDGGTPGQEEDRRLNPATILLAWGVSRCTEPLPNVCQKTAARGVRKAPLIPLPIMDEPFKRIAMDIVGPLPRSSSGKWFILGICDYETRYSEAIALRTIDANAVAEELLKFFARVRVPEEILTDQDTNFTSQLLTEVYQLL